MENRDRRIRCAEVVCARRASTYYLTLFFHVSYMQYSSSARRIPNFSSISDDKSNSIPSPGYTPALQEKIRHQFENVSRIMVLNR